MIKEVTFYICRGDNPNCIDSLGCFKNGGSCHHTTHLEFTDSPECLNPQRHPERFDAEVFANLPAYYFEILPDEKKGATDQNEEFEEEEKYADSSPTDGDKV